MHQGTIETNGVTAGDVPFCSALGGDGDGPQLPDTTVLSFLPPAEAGKMATLLRSRKFWATVTASAVSAYLYASGELSAESFASATALIAGIYVGSVALEDGLRGLVALWTRV